MKRRILPILVLTAAIFSGISVVRSLPKREPTTPPSPPPASSFEHTVAGVGLVEANTENIELSCAVPGLVTAVYAHAGEHVEAGQKLFSLDDRDLEADLVVKRTALAAAKAKLAKLEEEPRTEDIPPAEARVREAEA